MFDFLSVSAFPATAIFLVQHTLPPNCDRNATVVGDVCSVISAKYSVSTYQLTTVNADVIAACDNLWVGEVLCLGLAGQDCSTTYVVRSGDGCTGIANKFSIPESTLLQNNPNVNTDCTNIYPGEVLCISGAIYVN